MSTRRYYVGIGGSPRDSWKEHECFFAAIDACWQMAEEQAQDEGVDVLTLESWGGDDPDTGAGVCPCDEPGNDWPNIFIECVSSQWPPLEDE